MANQELQAKYMEVMAAKRENASHKQQLDRITSLENTVVSTMKQLVSFLDGKTTKTEVVNQLKSISTPDIDKVVLALEKLDKSVGKNNLDITPLKEGLTALEKQIKKLPTSFPEAPEQLDTVKVSNLSEIDFSKLEKAIKALDIAPKVDVKAPEVKVEAPNLKPLQDSLQGVIDAVKAQELPKTDLSKVEKQLDDANKHLKKLVEKPVGGGGGGGNGTPYIDDTGKPVNVQLVDGKIPVESASGRWGNYADARQDLSGDPMYFGKEDADGNWVIKQFGITSTETKYYEGTGGISANWAGRAGYTYEEFKDL